MTDQLTKHLATKGWTAVAFPSSEFRLFTLVFERGGARGHSNDFEFLAPGSAARLLPAEPVGQIPDLQGEQSRERSLSLGLSILSGLISVLGGGTLGLKLGFTGASKLTFTYGELSAVAISENGLQSALNQHPLPNPGLLRDWLDDHLYVATAVLYAKSVSVKASNQNGQEVGLDVPVIANAVGASVKVAAKNASSSEISFKGEAGIPIALRLYQIVKTKIDGQPRLTLRTIKQGNVDILSATPDSDLGGADLPVFDIDDIGLQGSDQPTIVVLDWDPDQ